MSTEIAVPPAEMVEAEGLVIRQANAMVIASDQDYAEAGLFLNQVIVAGKREVEEFFKPHVDRAYTAHKALTVDRSKHLEPWERAEKIVKEARVAYYKAEEARRDAERIAREMAARALEESRKRQEAEAERVRSAEEASRRRKEADVRRVAAEEEERRLRAIAAEAQTEKEVKEAEAKVVAQAEAMAVARERAIAEVRAIEEAGAEAAKAIENEKVIIDLPREVGAKLTGVAEAWGVNDKEWDSLEFAKWIGLYPAGRHQYIGSPAWVLLRAEAKQKKSLFDVGGITAGKKFTGRSGRS